MLKQLAEQYNLVLNLTAAIQRHNEVVKEKQHSETKKRRLWACFCFHSESQVQANLLFTRQLILSESAQQQDSTKYHGWVGHTFLARGYLNLIAFICIKT